jgi:hypothetical protein
MATLSGHDFDQLILKLTRDQCAAEPNIQEGVLHGENLDKYLSGVSSQSNNCTETMES